MIKINNLSFSYSKSANLLSSINLHLKSGQIHGLLGKNGEGKSTLLKLISGLVYTNNGEISVLDYLPQKRQPELLENIYLLPEDMPELKISIQQFERIYAPFYPLFNSEQFSNYLNQFEIINTQDVLNKLSHGQKKKVMIAFALAANTPLLLMDEPTNGLDIPSKSQFRKMVASAFNPNRCILISTHQVKDLEGLINNIIIMNEHKIIFDESIDTIAKKFLFTSSETPYIESNVIYSEESLQGKYHVCINETGEKSRIDIELLFNALLTNKENIIKLFEQ